MSVRRLLGALQWSDRPPRPRDVRRRAMAMTVTMVALFGATLSWWPDSDSWREWFGGGNAEARARAGHAAQQRQAEVRARFDQGVMMLHARQYEHAITAFHRVLELAPRMPEAHVNMGFALLGEQRFEAARDFFSSATELRRDQLNAYYGLALALEGLDDLPGAVGAMRAYLHRARDDDAFRPKAQAVLAQWEASLSSERHPQPAAAHAREWSPVSRR